MFTAVRREALSEERVTTECSQFRTARLVLRRRRATSLIVTFHSKVKGEVTRTKKKNKKQKTKIKTKIK